MYGDVINLLSDSTTTNSIGDAVKTPVSREVFADRKSIRQSEFYQAAAAGLKPEIMFEINLIDYEGERYLTYSEDPAEDPKHYTIIRTYEKDRDKIELICKRVVNKVAP